MSRSTAIWALAAICGIALAAAISWTTSQLTSQHIGLASEPLTAGQRLAPPSPAEPGGADRRTGETEKQSRASRTRLQSPATPTATRTTTVITQGNPETPPVATPGPYAAPGAQQGGSRPQQPGDDGGEAGGSSRSAGARDD